MDFCQTLIERARRHAVHAPRTIALPESWDARILQAAARAEADGIARCLLLGEPAAIRQAADAAGVTLPPSLRTIAPAPAQYLQPLIALREKQGKAMDAATAAAMLANPAALAAMLVHSGEADALVAGAATASADVLRPLLQIIGLAPGVPLASAVFLMCFNDDMGGMKVFADCAMNIAPDSAQLAAIAEQSAATARRFGLQPAIALLSFNSGGSDDERVRRVADAAAMLRQRLPDTPITGPIQYDAAVSPAIAAHKLPDDPVAGRANTLIFPDLQAGNITYKAVQQAAGIVSIGPLLQGLAAPANDLSRGASAEDIYYTIAATAVQAAEQNKDKGKDKDEGN